VDAAYGGMESPQPRLVGGGERGERARINCYRYSRETLIVTNIHYLPLEKMLQNIRDIPSYPLEISHIY